MSVKMAGSSAVYSRSVSAIQASSAGNSCSKAVSTTSCEGSLASCNINVCTCRYVDIISSCSLCIALELGPEGSC